MKSRICETPYNISRTEPLCPERPYRFTMALVTIRVSESNRERLAELAGKRRTYDDVITDLLAEPNPAPRREREG